MPLHRHKKFVRSKEPPTPLRIQSRDVELLRDLAEYRFLDTEQILALHPGGSRNLRRRLSSLYHLGFVDRPEAQKLLPPGNYLIYSLGEKGAELLSAEGLIGKKTSEVTFPYLAHALMISRFRSILTLALRKHPDQPQISRWVQGYDLKELLSFGKERLELVPDAFFTIEHKEDVLHFFLEADRGTMTRERVLEKTKIYWQWWRDGRCREKPGITCFRVLTIAPSKERAENLRRASKDADIRKEGSAMFLFATEDNFSLEKPEAILSPVWLSPKDKTSHHILE